MKDKKRMNVFQHVKAANNLFTADAGRKLSRSLHMTGAAVTASTFVAIGKLVLGILALSFFACANAFYSFGMIIAKGIALIGIRKAQGKEEQCRYYLSSGIVLIFSSLIYIIYSVRLFFSPITSYYDKYAAITIATVTFTEIGLNIRGVIMTRHNHTLLIHAIKMINLSASVIALVLTQTALLSFTDMETDLQVISRSNGVTGVLMGIVVTAIGVYMVCRARKIRSQKVKEE